VETTSNGSPDPWQAHARFFFFILSVTRQEIIQFTCQPSAKTVMLPYIFSLRNTYFQVNVFQ